MARRSITILLACFMLAFGLALADQNAQETAELEGGIEFVIDNKYDENDDGEFDDLEDFNVVPFSDEWTKFYTDEQLSRQPTWYSVGEKGNENGYMIREYPSAWWASSYTPCLNQSLAIGYGYLKLYLYFQKYNYQRIGYPLTYPILTKIELNGGGELDEGMKERERCQDKYSQNLFLPIDIEEYPAASPDESIRAEIVPTRRYYVMRYGRNDIEDFQPTTCNAHAGVLAASLALDGVSFNPFTWYCAQYEPGSSGINGVFEVWFEGSDEV